MSGYQTEAAERQAALRRKVDGANARDGTPEHPLLMLQSQIGNAQVARLLAQRAEAEEQTLQRAEDDEQTLQRAEDDEQTLQRAEDDEQTLQRAEDSEQVGMEGGAVGPDTAQRIASARGGGSALDSGTRATMESGFGASFGDVRVHHDSQSDMLTRRLTSHAFTTGSDIFLRGDASPSDNHLIAHELTHVVQQRDMGGSSSMTVGAAADPHEHQADAMADAVLSGSTGPAAAAPAGAQRAEDDEQTLQRAEDDEQTLQRAEDDEQTLQRAEDDERTLQRAEDDEQTLNASHDLSLQRESADDQ
jgi:hypothetical protein